jgi:hypothetical protein
MNGFIFPSEATAWFLCMQQNWLDLYPLLAYLWISHHNTNTAGLDAVRMYVGHVRWLHVYLITNLTSPNQLV